MSSTSASGQPRLSPAMWNGDPQLCPPWVGFPSPVCFPAGLHWSGRDAVPVIGARVHIYMNGFGRAEVRGYFHADGFLGVICVPDSLPAWFRQQCPGVTLYHFFGRELEPYQSTSTPVIGSLDDWIPEYTPED